ncbi:hypothetical protein PENSOL_c059G01929 [Penicillium solitum]|uniref:Uncharacterized protein n=1 Tax=Penicillium solitum TaxID=60172 RepID=A0A1V6QMR8_9EURO|nr:uncharacterized protein PENSOL_c059G01929 [Penicillium solitum]OQD90277.1 hypothetical protein PENSOL_c059G01929 [Penicillium solitum]
MSVPQYTSGLPYYYKVDSVTDTTITYRMLYLKPNVKPESEKWQPRIERCCIAVLILSLILMAIHIEAPHASSAFRYAVLILQVFMLCVQFYGVVRHFLALRRAGWEQKGRGYDLSFGPAYTYTLAPPPVDSGLGVPLPWKDPDDAYVSGNTE